MHHTTSTGQVPGGRDFVERIMALMTECEEKSKQAPDLIEGMGKLIWIMDAASSCWWGCRQDNHAAEGLVGRCSSYAVAALKLANSGFYDESLALVRTISEGANLVYLFAVDPASLEEWKVLREDTAWKKFSPGQVRKALEARGRKAPIDKQRYGTLCCKATHPTPNIPPQMYNSGRFPMAGGKYQEAGLFVCLAELALATMVVAGCTAVILPPPDDTKLVLLQVTEQVQAEIARARERVNGHFPGTYREA